MILTPPIEKSAKYTMEQALTVAQGRLPVSRLLQQRGYPVKPSQMRCPFCSNDTAQVKPYQGTELFKCWHNPCPTENESLSPVGVVRLLQHCSKADALWMWLKEAGIDRMEIARSVEVRAKLKRGPGAKGKVSRDEGSSGEGVKGDVDAPPWEEASGTAAEPAAEPGVEAPVVEPAADLDREGPDLETAGDVGGPAGEGGTNGNLSDAEDDGAARAEVLAAGPADARGEPAEDLVVEPAADDDPAVLVKREFWAALAPEDPAKLRRRGLIAQSVQNFGLRRNHRGNEEILRRLCQKHGVRLMVRAGLYVHPRDAETGAERMNEEPRPNAQFCGLGLAGKDGRFEYTDPTIIPYLNAAGQVVELRPHKGGIASGNTTFSVAPRLYVARRVGQEDRARNPKVAMVTEGEFKAMAFWQAMNWGDHAGSCAAAAVPGISMGKHHEGRPNHFVWDGLMRWLEATAPQTVCIVFDNECKSDPRFRSYKPDPWKRYDTQAWAMLTAELLRREHYHVTVGKIPDEVREEGKADWDGWLGALLAADAAA